MLFEETLNIHFGLVFLCGTFVVSGAGSRFGYGSVFLTKGSRDKTFSNK
jgi:inosine/xanthosine triphosphate pyrophosphatase family protein